MNSIIISSIKKRIDNKLKSFLLSIFLCFANIIELIIVITKFNLYIIANIEIKKPIRSKQI
jgi:hypothetical protein